MSTGKEGIRLIIIQNGQLVSPQGLTKADLAIEDGRIAAIAEHIEPGENDTVQDAEGCYVFPGFIDGHTHLDMDSGVTVTADDFTTGTRAAVCGGTTTLVDFATQDKGDTLMHALEAWHKKAQGKSSCNYAFHMAITDWNEAVKAEIPQMFEQGVTSFKAYMAYDALKVNDAELLDILKTLKPYGGILGVHCENGLLVNALQAEQKAQGHFSPAAHPVSRPPEVEAEAINRLCYLGKLADMPVHVVHLSSALGLAEIRNARAQGVTVYAETCPQYLTLDETRYKAPGFEGAKYVMSPPLRSAADVQALREAVAAGEIDTIATDHCSYNFKGQKELGLCDFTKIPNGGPGLEHRPMVVYTSMVQTGELNITEFCRLLAEGPAKLFGMYPQKGVLAVGSDADITIWDPKAKTVITAARQQQNVDYTPYEGFAVTGMPKAVFVGGVLAAEYGQPTGKVVGTYVKR